MLGIGFGLGVLVGAASWLIVAVALEAGRANCAKAGFDALEARFERRS
jgi:hypothetical protein